MTLPPSARGAVALSALLVAGGAMANGSPAPITVQFANCSEFVGIAAADAARVRALVPPRFTPVIDGAGAKLVVRVVDCAGVRVGALPARPARVAQIGAMIVSPDGTATDPNTSINNYTLSFATNAPALALALRSTGVPAALDAGLAVEATPTGAVGGAADFYAAVSPDLDAGSPTWFLHGTVFTPSYNSPFLANWWLGVGLADVKMATDIPLIAFDFSSQMTFATSRLNVIGALLPGHAVSNWQLTFRGAFDAGTMLVTVRR
jgi:hypothetical protein